MNPQFRYVKLKLNELRKITNSTVTVLKQQENLVLNNSPRRPECSHALQRVFDSKLQLLGGPEQQNAFVKDYLHQGFIFRNIDEHNDLNNKTRVINKQTQREANKSNSVSRAVFGANFSDIDIDVSKLEFVKTNHNAQKENLNLREDSDLQDRKYQNSNDKRKNSSSVDPNDENKPTYAQLQRVAQYYEEQIYEMHLRCEDFSLGLHHDDMIFENNYTRFPGNCQGFMRYRAGLANMRTLGNISYVAFRFHPVNIRCDMEEGAVILHWRLYYINNLRFLTKAAPRALLDRSLKNIYDEDEAISTFYLDEKGQIIKHRVDKTVPLTKKAVKLSLVDKLRKRLAFLFK